MIAGCVSILKCVYMYLWTCVQYLSVLEVNGDNSPLFVSVGAWDLALQLKVCLTEGNLRQSSPQSHRNMATHRKSLSAYSSRLSPEDNKHIRCMSLKERKTHVRNITCAGGRSGCGPLWSLVNQVGAQLFPGGHMHSAGSYWLPCVFQLPHCPTFTLLLN